MTRKCHVRCEWGEKIEITSKSYLSIYQLKETLIAQLKAISTSPFLFIGSGLSRRYLGIEDWEHLLRKFCQNTKKPFEYYASSSNGDFPTIGTHLAKEFHEIWWKETIFSHHRTQYKEDSLNTESALKIEISAYMKAKSQSILLGYEKELEQLKKMINIQGIITTNWDLFLETCLPDFQVYTGQEDLFLSPSYGVGEIYKLHGCCKNPNSLVLTAKDYHDFETKNPYLIAKLLAIFVEHPIIFLGYSLSDSHITNIFKKIIDCLGQKNLEKLRNKIIFVEWDESPSIYSCISSTISVNGISIPITKVNCSSFEPVYESILSIDRRLPAKVLRACKKHVYELVVEEGGPNKEQRSVYLLDIDRNTNIEECDFVLGVGAFNRLSEQGYVGLKTDAVFHDIVFDDQKYDPNALLKKFFPEQLKGKSKFFPIFKYLVAASIKSKEEFKHNPELKHLEKIVNLKISDYYPQKIKDLANIRKSITTKTVKGVIKDFELKKGLNYLHFLLKDEINLEDFKKVLQEHYHLLHDEKQKYTYRKLVCLYDKLKYGF